MGKTRRRRRRPGRLPVQADRLAKDLRRAEKKRLMRENPHCHYCERSVRLSGDEFDNAILYEDVLVCPRCNDQLKRDERREQLERRAIYHA